MSAKLSAILQNARLVGHSSTRTTEVIYRKELRPVINTGATIMDRLFPDSGRIPGSVSCASGSEPWPGR
jgi:hypothetical protein